MTALVAGAIRRAGVRAVVQTGWAGLAPVGDDILLDQPFWAARLHLLGVAPLPLPRRELTAGALVDALAR